MSIQTDLAESWRYVEGVEDVTFTPQTPPAAAIQNVKAKRKARSRGEVLFGGQAGISPTDIVFHLWVSTLSGKSANPGDTITDSANVVYQVITAQLLSMSQRWRCVCRKHI